MNQPHPDDELLSASLDGEADTDAATHIAGCTSCQARRVALDGVRQAVRAMPPPPGVDVTERAVAAALAAWSGEQSSRVVVPLPKARARRRLPPWALGAAAAVAALVVAVPLLTGGGGDGTEQTASAPARQTDNSATADAGAAVLDGGDLGEQSDQIALGQILQGAVAAPAPSTAAAASPEAATGAEGAPAADEKRLDTTTFASTSPCAGAVRGGFGRGLGPLIYSASLHWQGIPSVVVAYRLEDVSGPGPDHRAFVMARDGCRLLVVQGF